MRSLQVLTPSEKCMFDCPFCISKTHQHENIFFNLYQKDHVKWKQRLCDVLKMYDDLKYVVITGTSEPMQNQKCVQDIIEVVREHRKDVSIEIQTHFYLPTKLYDFVDTVAYSISEFSLLNKIKVRGIVIRYVILLTDSFSDKTLEDILNFVPDTVSQITFKVLHDSNGYNKDVDEWIRCHQTNMKTIDKLKKDILDYHGSKSIRFDEFCMNSYNRYEIFREDGNLYKDWDAV